MASANTIAEPTTLSLLFALDVSVLFQFKSIADDASAVITEADTSNLLRDEAVRNHVPHHPPAYAGACSINGRVFKLPGPIAGPVMDSLGRRRVCCYSGRRRSYVVGIVVANLG